MRSILQALGLLSLCLNCSVAHAFKIHFNQAWFKNDYAHFYQTGSFDPNEVQRIMDLAKGAGSDELRLWFFESSVGQVPAPSEIQNRIETLRIAKTLGMKVYFTFFDAWSPAAIAPVFTEQGSRSYLNNVVIPLFQKIEQAGLANVISKIDLVNEADALIDRKILPGAWDDLKLFICQWKQSIHQVRAFQTTPITVSLRLDQYASLPSDLLDPDGTMACADYYDFHSYHTQGVIDRCDQLRIYSQTRQKQMVLGEFAQGYDAQQFDDQLQLDNVKAYASSAPSCGFVEAFAWRLSDIRPGVNPDARFSYEANGRQRPAYRFIQNWNQNH
jgi:hypothetical protein